MSNLIPREFGAIWAVWTPPLIHLERDVFRREKQARLRGLLELFNFDDVD